ncbi:MAG: hypothetical protein K9G76_00855 [Bacteroidales bacterium]|nr:hypothetical protein [Bacteroidales bacterium]
MRIVLANLALLFGIIGFAGYLFLIIAGAFGCCAGVTTVGYHKIVLFILSAAVVIFAICMFNNCCRIKKKE